MAAPYQPIPAKTHTCCVEQIGTLACGGFVNASALLIRLTRSVLRIEVAAGEQLE